MKTALPFSNSSREGLNVAPSLQATRRGAMTALRGQRDAHRKSAAPVPALDSIDPISGAALAADWSRVHIED